MTDANAPRKKRKGLHLLLLILVTGAMWCGYFRWSVSRGLAPQIQWLESRGYPVTLEKLDDWYVLPNGQENAADLYLQAFASLADVVPVDPYDGQTLRYLRQAEGFRVYSVGEDRQDNGGIRRNRENRGKNCDWPFVVTFSDEMR